MATRTTSKVQPDDVRRVARFFQQMSGVNTDRYDQPDISDCCWLWCNLLLPLKSTAHLARRPDESVARADGWSRSTYLGTIVHISVTFISVNLDHIQLLS